MLLERLFVEIAADVSKLEKGLRGADRDLQRFARRVEGIGQSMTLYLTAPLALVGAGAVRAAVNMQSLEMGLTAVTGSAGEAATQLERLREIARLPGVDLEQAAQSSIALQSIGKSAEFAERMVRGVANAVTLSGGGQEEFGGVMRQLRQVASLGRLMGEEMNVILENAPAMAAAIQSAFGTTSTEAIRELGLTSDEFFARLMTAMEELPQVAGGAKNTLDNLWASLREAGATIGDVLLPVVVDIAEKIASMAEALTELNPAVVRWYVAIGAAAAAMGPLLIVVGNLIPALLALKTAGMALLPVFGVGAAVAVGIAAMTVLFLDHAAATKELEKATADLADAQKRLMNPDTAGGALRRLGEQRNLFESLGGRARLAELQRQINEEQRGFGREDLAERDRLLEVAATIRNLESLYVRLANAATVAADAVDRVPGRGSNGTDLMNPLGFREQSFTPFDLSEFAEFDIGAERMVEALEKVRLKTKHLDDVSLTWADAFGQAVAGVAFQLDNIGDALENIFRMIAQQVVGNLIGSVAGFITNPVETFIGGLTGGGAASSVVAGGSRSVVLDMSSVPDDSFWSGRQVKEGLATAFRSLEDDGYKVRT